ASTTRPATRASTPASNKWPPTPGSTRADGRHGRPSGGQRRPCLRGRESDQEPAREALVQGVLALDRLLRSVPGVTTSLLRKGFAAATATTRRSSRGSIGIREWTVT